MFLSVGDRRLFRSRRRYRHCCLLPFLRRLLVRSWNSRNEKAQCDFEAYKGRVEGEDLIGVSVTALRRMKPTPAAAEVSNFFVAAVNVIKVYPMHGSCRDG